MISSEEENERLDERPSISALRKDWVGTFLKWDDFAIFARPYHLALFVKIRPGWKTSL